MTEDKSLPPHLIEEIEGLLDRGRALDAYQIVQAYGPLDDWSDLESLLVAARLIQHLGGLNRAKPLVHRAFRMNPKSGRALVSRLYLLQESWSLLGCWQFMQKLDDAEFDSSKDQAEAMASRARICGMFRDYSTGSYLLQQATSLAPQNPWVWCSVGFFWLQQNEQERALEFIDHSLACFPHYRSSVLLKGQILQNLGKDQEAVDFLERERLHLQSFSVSQDLAGIYNLFEVYTEALDRLGEAEQIAFLADERLKKYFLRFRVEILLQYGEWEQVEPLLQGKERWMAKIRERFKDGGVTRSRVRISIPFVRQDHNTCAPATLSALTGYWEQMIPQDTIIQDICYDGTPDHAQRNWLQKNGWVTREFKMTWESTVELLNRKIPFLLLTMGVESGHAQAVIGYESALKRVLIQDPNMRHYSYADWDDLAKDQEPYGPQAMVFVPADRADLIADLVLPEQELYDIYFRFNSAMAEYRRDAAELVMAELEQHAPGHRLTLTAKRSLSAFDDNPIRHLRAVEELLVLYPDSFGLLRSQFMLLSHLGQIQQAHELVDTVSKKRYAPDFFLRERGRVLSRDARNGELPIRLLRRSLARNPTNAGGLLALAVALWTQDKRSLALEVQRLAVCVEDKREDSTNTFVKMMITMGQQEPAIAFLKQRFELLGGRSAGPGLSYIRCLLTLQMFNEADIAIKQALELRPTDGALLLEAAGIRSRAADAQGALELLNRAEGKCSKSDWLRQSSHMAFMRGDVAAEENAYRALLQLAPLDMQAHNGLVNILANRDGQKAAQQYLKDLGDKFPHHPGILQLESSWVSRDEPDYMMNRLASYNKLHPHEPWSCREIALFLLRKDATSEALEWAQYARSIEPGNFYSWTTEGAVLEKLGRIQEARQVYRAAVQIDADASYAVNRLFSLSATEAEEMEDLLFFRQEIARQVVSGPAIGLYRVKAHRLTEPSELLNTLKTFCDQRSELWECWDALFKQYETLHHDEGARYIADEMVRRFPIYPACWERLASIQIKQGKLDEALISQRRGLALNPNYVELVAEHIYLLYRMNLSAEAEQLIIACEQRNPREVAFLGIHANLLINREESDKALSFILKALQMDRHYDWAWNRLSRKKALETCEALFKEFPKDDKLASRLSWLLPVEQAKRKVDLAKFALDMSPYDVNRHINYVDQLVAAKRMDEAMKACQVVIYGDKIPSELVYRGIILLSEQGKQAQAVSALEKFLEEEPNFYAALNTLQDWYFKEKKYKKSLELLDRAIRITPLAAQLYHRRGELHQLLNMRAEAKADFEQSIKIKPNQAAAEKLYGILSTAKDWTGVEQLLNQVERQIDDGFELSVRFCLWMNQSKWAEARELIVKNATGPNLHEMTLEAFKLFPKEEGKKCCAELEKLILHPNLHWWVLRMWKVFDPRNHRLYPLKPYLPKPKYRAWVMYYFLVVSFEIGDEKNRSLLDEFIKKNPEACKLDEVWGAIGGAYVGFEEFENAVKQMKDWKVRKEVSGPNLANYVIALQVLGQYAEAVHVSETALTRNLEYSHEADYFHHCYLTLSYLERGDLKKALHHLPQKEKYLKLFISFLRETIAVFQAGTPLEKRAAFLTAWKTWVQRYRTGPKPGKMYWDIRKRILQLAAVEAGLSDLEIYYYKAMNWYEFTYRCNTEKKVTKK